MESLLERGEKLDDLVSKSEVLGIQSKAFYKTVSVAWPLLGTPSLGSPCLWAAYPHPPPQPPQGEDGSSSPLLSEVCHLPKEVPTLLIC